jgi:hypothetical protein
MGWDGRVGRSARKDLAPPSLIESSSPRWAGVVKYGAEPEHDLAPPSLSVVCCARHVECERDAPVEMGGSGESQQRSQQHMLYH